MADRLRGRRLCVLILGALMLAPAIVTAQGASSSINRELAAGPATGMMLFLRPATGGQPPNTLYRIYPDETGLAQVDLGTPLDVRRAIISPDGSRFALYVIEAGNIGRIYLAAADGSSLEMLPLTLPTSASKTGTRPATSCSSGGSTTVSTTWRACRPAARSRT